MAVSNFTYGAGNPLNTKVDPYAIAAKATADDPLSRPASELIYNPQYGNPLNMDARPIVATEENTNVQPGATGKGGGLPAGTPPDLSKKPKDLSELNAYALLEELFRMYNLEELVPVIQGYMADGIGSAQAKILLKTNEVYKTRFKGNELRVAQGLNAISEAEYITLENDYTETLRAYGQSDFFGPLGPNGRKARTAKMAEVIGFDLSANQFDERISTAVTRVKNGDAGTRDAFATLYGVTDSDLIKYFLNPVEGSAQLKAKVAAAEISGASINAGLGMTSLGTSEELAKLGIDKAAARVGYENIANYLPRTTTLGKIYNETGINYTKATGEEEEFKGLASAKRKRQELKQLELGSFAGSSGTTKGSFSTSYLNKQSSAGQF